MTFIIASFRSRTQAAKFENLLKRNKIPCTLINTPREISVGCGVSVKFPEGYMNSVKRLLQTIDPQSYAGLFRINDLNYGKISYENLI